MRPRSLLALVVVGVLACTTPRTQVGPHHPASPDAPEGAVAAVESSPPASSPPAPPANEHGTGHDHGAHGGGR